ncbi:hypothetical protein ACTXT7_004360 [Hymenolepis weldensis]
MATDVEAQVVQEPHPSPSITLPDFEVPAGLRFLLRTTNLRVYRVPIEGENKCCSAFPRKFYVADGEGNAILEGVETSSWCGRLCAESCHGFELDFRDADGVTVLSMEKTAACSTFYCCNAPAISVTSGTDNYGTVTHTGSIPRTRLTISDAIDRPQLSLLGPCTRQSHYIDGIFKDCAKFVDTKRGFDELGSISGRVQSTQKIEIEENCLRTIHTIDTKTVKNCTSKSMTTGSITEFRALKCFNKSGSLGRVTVQHFAGMDSYQLFFPIDMDVRMKCIIIASAVLLLYEKDNTFFVGNNKNRSKENPRVNGLERNSMEFRWILVGFRRTPPFAEDVRANNLALLSCACHSLVEILQRLNMLLLSHSLNPHFPSNRFSEEEGKSIQYGSAAVTLKLLIRYYKSGKN